MVLECVSQSVVYRMHMMLAGHAFRSDGTHLAPAGIAFFLDAVMQVLLGMLHEEGVDLVIGDSSLCAVMPEVFFPCCKGWRGMASIGCCGASGAYWNGKAPNHRNTLRG